MRAVWMSGALVIALSGCGGDATDTDTGPALTCDNGLGTEPLGAVPADEWPEGLSNRFATYNALGGRFEVSNSCGEPFALKLTLPGTGTQEDIQVVTSPYDPQLSCGCIADPSFDPDSKYDHIGVVEDLSLFVESFGAVGVDDSTIEGRGVLFAPGEPLAFRMCATKTIDPAENSEYEQFTAIIRVDAGGVLNGTLQLARPGGEVETCELSGFTLIAD